MPAHKRLRKIARKYRNNPAPHKAKKRRKSHKQQQLEYLHRKQKGICAICHLPVRLRDANIDHIIPKAQGGRNHISNYQATHQLCNTEKGDQIGYKKL